MTDVSNLFLYLSLGLIVLWTVRLARSKGRNPFLWGGSALLLMLIPSWPDLLGMGPMMVLLFLKSPQIASQEPVPETVTCPKCHAYHAAGHTYCVNCGWELGRAFSGKPQQRSEAIAAAQVEPVPVPTPEQVGPPVEQPARSFTSRVASPVFEPPSGPEDSAPVSEPPSGPEDPAPVFEPDSAKVSEEVEASDAVAAGTAPEPEPEVQQPAVVRYPITPAGLTERGSALMVEGNFQMAIDQFTKAIALDPGYRPAWTGRAEAYAVMGQEDKAKQDRLHLDGLPARAAE